MKLLLPYILLFFLSYVGYFNLSAQVDGKFYSLMYYGGINLEAGTINVFDPLTNKDTDVFDFNYTDGMEPYGNFIQLSNGMLYGMTAYGGPDANSGKDANGNIIRYNIQTGQDTVLYNFSAGGDSGQYVYGTLCHATNDTLYGITTSGGSRASGVLFSFNYHTGVYTLLDTLTTATIGALPTGSLMQASNGLLYGLTTYNPTGDGTIFSYNIETGDTLLLHTFTGAPNDGNYPRGYLIQASNGILYGLTVYGGTYNDGVLFSYNTTTNTEAVLYSFGSNGTDGIGPEGSLMQASDGNLYGTTTYGGTYNNGTLFSYNIATSTETVLHSFSGGTTDGDSPYADVIQASDGLLYGNTNLGGTNDLGVIFSYNIGTSTETTLYSYNGITGANPYGDLLEVMSAPVSTVNNNCPNDSAGSLSINVRGGKYPLTYSWSTGATTGSISGLASGVYTDTVRDSKGITFYSQDTIYPLPMAISFTATNPCYGTNDGIITANVSGGTSPFSYTWSNSYTTDTLSNLAAGTYTCTVTDAHSCPVTIADTTITEAAALTINSVVVTEYPVYNNASITVNVSGGVPAGDSACYLYLWSIGGIVNYNYDSSTITNLDSGTYGVCVTSCYGCGSVCDDDIIVTGVPNTNNTGSLAKVYPVPSIGLITINLPGDGFENIEITDALGRQIYEQALSSQIKDNTLNIDLGGQANGVYILYISSRQGILTRKIIIQK